MQLTRVLFPESNLPQVYVEISTWNIQLYYSDSLVLTVALQEEDESNPGGESVGLEPLETGQVFEHVTDEGEKLFLVLSESRHLETFQFDGGDFRGGDFINNEAELEYLLVGIGVYSSLRKQRAAIRITASSVEAGTVKEVPTRVREEMFKRLLRAG